MFFRIAGEYRALITHVLLSQRCPSSPNILNNVLRLAIQIFLNLEASDSKITSDWLNHTVYPIRSCVTVRFINFVRNRQSLFFRKGGEYTCPYYPCQASAPSDIVVCKMRYG